MNGPNTAANTPDDLIPEFPADITIIKGKEMACREGCVNNSLNNLQLMHFDQHGKGGWTMVMGKGFDESVVAGIQGRVFVVGPCAVKEIGQKLVDRLGKGKVYFCNECNDLTAMVESMCHLMKVSPLKLAPPINPIKAMVLFLQSMLNHSTGRMTSPLANFIKLR